MAQRDEYLCTVQPTRRCCHFFKSYFMSARMQQEQTEEGHICYRNVRRWGSRVHGGDIFQLDKLFFPVNITRTHWALVTVFMEDKRIQFYDSMGAAGTESLEAIFQYIQQEHLTKLGYPLEDTQAWQLVACTDDTPRQGNGFDCGVFCCTYMDLLASNAPLNFDQTDMMRCRKRLALAIIQGRALAALG